METTSEMTGHQIISLFPLGVVLLPHMEMPLHIFEVGNTSRLQCPDQPGSQAPVFSDTEHRRIHP